MKKTIAIFLMVALLSMLLTSCDSLRDSVELPHFNGVTEDGSYDSKYFYRNDLRAWKKCDKITV